LCWKSGEYLEEQSSGVEHASVTVEFEFSCSQNTSGDGGFNDSSAANDDFCVAGQNKMGKAFFNNGSPSDEGIDAAGRNANGEGIFREDAENEGSFIDGASTTAGFDRAVSLMSYQKNYYGFCTGTGIKNILKVDRQEDRGSTTDSGAAINKGFAQSMTGTGLLPRFQNIRCFSLSFTHVHVSTCFLVYIFTLFIFNLHTKRYLHTCMSIIG
jgi:hypothetical protein